ncbi:MAG: hypothetical protein PHG82_02930 [Candidatus Gracilibacteria bacterium]|nr:hypothetical protein [Candidatus Gracilibacteria bacterium]
MRIETSTLGVEQLNRNYDQDLKKYFCNIRIGKILLDESFEEFYSSFLGKNNEFDYTLFQNTIEYINTLLDNNSMNIRYDSIEEYIGVYSNSVKDILSDEDLETNSMMKLKEDLDDFSSKIFKRGGEIENKESIKKRIKAFIALEKFKIENIKLDYANDRINLTINTFTKKFFELI